MIKELEDIHSQYKVEARRIETLIDKFRHSLKTGFERKTKKPADSSAMEAIGESLNKIINSNDDADSAAAALSEAQETIKSLPKDAIERLVTMVGFIEDQSILAEMSLGYLISHQEAFVKDYLQELMIHRPSILKSKKQMTYEEVLSFSSMDALARFMAESEVESLGYQSIDDVAKYFGRD